jgi:transcriptional regulator with XRE-family HTH domain
MLTPAQLRAARALVDWSRDELAEASKVGHNTIKDFERKGSDIRQSTVQKLTAAFAKEGIEFTPESDVAGAGVRFKKGFPKEGKRR